MFQLRHFTCIFWSIPLSVNFVYQPFVCSVGELKEISYLFLKSFRVVGQNQTTRSYISFFSTLTVFTVFNVNAFFCDFR